MGPVAILNFAESQTDIAESSSKAVHPSIDWTRDRDVYVLELCS